MDFLSLYNENKLKIQGRFDFRGNMLSAFWSANGFEMNVRCESGTKMLISAKTNDSVFLTLFIDGDFIKRSPLLNEESSDFSFGVPAGVHTVKIVRDSQISTNPAVYFYFSNISFAGEILEKPADKKLFIEVIGDSIACGDGSLGKYTPGEKWREPEDHSAINGFAYKLAEKMNADWSLVCRGGIGLFSGAEAAQEAVAKKRVKIQEIYDYINGYRDFSEKNNFYSFARKPDLIIFEISGNDSINAEDLWRSEAVSFLRHVREKNGDVPIIWSGKKQVHYETLLSVRESGDIPNFYTCFYKYGGSGSAARTTQTSGHPSAEEQTMIAENLYDFITHLFCEKK